MWQLPGITTRNDAVAFAVYELASERGLEAVTIRAVAARARMAPGTITNHYATRDRLLAVCAAVLGRWLVWANDQQVRSAGPRGLLPGPFREAEPGSAPDLYRRLLVVWGQLEAYALTSPAVAEQVGEVNALAREMLAWQRHGAPNPALTPRWLVIRGLQAELLRPGTGLSVAQATELLAQA